MPTLQELENGVKTVQVVSDYHSAAADAILIATNGQAVGAVATENFLKKSNTVVSLAMGGVKVTQADSISEGVEIATREATKAVASYYVGVGATAAFVWTGPAAPFIGFTAGTLTGLALDYDNLFHKTHTISHIGE